MSILFTRQEFASKVDWEGGIFGALDYGLTEHGLDRDSDLYELWADLRKKYEALAPLVSRVEKELWR